MTIHNPLGFMTGGFIGRLLEQALERPILREPPDVEAATPIPAVHDVASGLDIVDLRGKASTAKYPNGRNKRDRYRRVNLAERKVTAVLHQTAFVWPETSRSWHKVTAHYVISPAGRVLWLYDHDVRLVCSNWLDERPYHGIGIEVAGNFEGVDGSGKWWGGDTFGRSRATLAQIEAARLLVAHIAYQLEDAGAELYGIAPHRYAASDRSLCPGSRIWSEVGEWCARDMDIRLPKPGPSIFRGAQSVPDEWHGPHWQDGEGLKWLE